MKRLIFNLQFFAKNASDSKLEDSHNDEGVKISNGKNKVKLKSGDNADTIDNKGSEVTIDSGSGIDEIINYANKVSINAGADNDEIIIDKGASNVTIVGGADNDSIVLNDKAHLIQYSKGDGEDTIVGFNPNDTLQLMNEKFSEDNCEWQGNDLIIHFSEGSITLKNVSNKIVCIKDSKGIHYIETLSQDWELRNGNELYASVTKADDLDLTKSYGKEIEIVDASKLESKIRIKGNAHENTITGGKGNDTLDGGAGNDELEGGKGNDVFIYSGGDDTITDYGNGTDSIMIATDGIKNNIEYDIDGNDAILYISKGSIKVTNIKYINKDGQTEYKKILVMDTSKNQIPIYRVPEGWSIDSNKKSIKSKKSPSDTEIDLNEPSFSEVETVDASGATVDVKIYGNSLNNVVKGGTGNDTLNGGDNNDTLTGNAGEDVFVYSGGSDYITDYTAGKDSIMVALDDCSIIDVETKYNDVIFYTNEGDFTVKGGKALYTDNKIVLIDENWKVIPIPFDFPKGWNLSEKDKKITAEKNAESFLNLTQPYGKGIESVDGANVKNGVQIYGNELANSIKGSAGADIIRGDAGNDSISLGGSADTYIYSGGDDFIFDYEEGKDLIQFEIDVVSASLSNDDLVIKTSEGTLTIQNGKNKNITVKDGAHSGSFKIKNKYPDIDTIPAGWKISGKTATATSVKAAVLNLNEGYGKDVVTVEGSKVTGGVQIYGNDNNNSIRGGKGNDTVSGGYGNDTVSLGGGADVYIYQGGNDVILDYANEDFIELETKTISAEFSNKDLVIKTAEGNLTIKGGKDKIIKGKDSEGYFQIPNKIDTIPAGWKISGTAATATSVKADVLNLNEGYGKDVVTADGSKVTGGVQIYGNDNNNSIRGGKGNDTVGGGYGNDTVSLGGGADVYIYQGGNDVIQDYANADKIYFETDIISAATLSNKDLVIKTAEGNLTIKGGTNKNITVKDTANKEEFVILNVYPSTELKGWAISGNTAKAISANADSIDLTQEYGKKVEVVEASIAGNGIVIIANEKNNVIKGGKGKDTIFGGKGNDTILMNGGADVYVYSNGNDLIQDYNTVDAIYFETEIISATTNSKKDLVITTANGNVTIKNGQNQLITVKDTAHAEEFTILNEYPVSTLQGWQINNKNAKATLTNSDNLDLTQSYGEAVVTVDASKVTVGVQIFGNDKNNSIRGGNGADTIGGGFGKDTVSLGGGADVYIYSGGNDIIQDYTTVDKIYFETKIDSAKVSNKDLIITTEKGKITIAGGKDKDITVKDTAHSDEFKIYNEYPVPTGLPGWKFSDNKASATSENASDIDLTETYGQGITVVDAAIVKSGISISGNLKSSNSIKGGSGPDTITGGNGNDTVSLGAGADVFIFSGGNDLIQDYNSDNDEIYFNTKIKSASLSGSGLIIAASGGQIAIKNAKDKPVTVTDPTGTFKIVNEYPKPVSVPKNWKRETSKKLLQATASNAEKHINLNEEYGNGIEKVDASNVTSELEIFGNDLDNSIKGGTGNNKLYGGSGNDILTGGKGNDILDGGSGNDTLTGGDGKDIFVFSGGYDVFTDYTAGKDSIRIAFDFSEIEVESLGADLIAYTDEGTFKIAKAADKDILVMDANNKKIDLVGLPAGWKYGSSLKADSTSTLITATLKTANSNIDLSKKYALNVTKADASELSKGIQIYGNDLNNVIKGGKGNDTIGGSGGDDTVSLGGGNDIYIYGGGNDLIQDYTEGADFIQIDTGNVEIIGRTAANGDLTFNTNIGNLKIFRGANKNITLIDMNGKRIVEDALPNGWELNTYKKILKATIASAEDLDLTKSYGVDILTVNASTTGDGVEIIGNNLGNSIRAGNGEDTIWGGNGDDTVSLGGGADVYIYTGGNDVIEDYAAGQDSIQVEPSKVKFNSVKAVGNSLVYQTSQGTLTLKNCSKDKSKSVAVINMTNRPVIIPTLNKNVAENLWFMDDNFISDDTNLESITEEKFAVTQIQTANYNFEQEQNILTYGEDK